MSLIYINPYTFAAAETFLLDTYSGAAAAYSLRNLSSSTTNVVRVRRSSGSPSEADFTALQVANGELAAWVGAGNDGFVAIWYDQSGNGNDASNAVLQPKIVINGAVSQLNTKPCITYNTYGTDTLAFTRLTTVRSVFEVLQIDSNQLTAPNFLLGDTTNYDYHGGGSTWLHPSISAAVVRNGSNRINNVITNLTTTDRVSSQLLISMIHTGNAAAARISADRSEFGRSIRGLVQEVIIYTTDQTSNVAGINGNINAHYGIYTNPTNWTPAQITTELWFDAADSSTITTAGGSVSAWNDKSGNARNATQATAANQPTHSTTGFNGLPGITFSAVNQNLVHGSGTTAAVTLVAVYRTNAFQLQYNTVISTTTNLLLARNFSGRIGSYGGGDINSTVSYVVGQTVMVIVEDDNTGGTKTFWINGSASGTYTQNPAGQSPGTIGGFDPNNDRSLITVAECLALPGIPTTTNRQLVEGYLAHKWALTGSLPANHPYKTTAPTV